MSIQDLDYVKRMYVEKDRSMGKSLHASVVIPAHNPQPNSFARVLAALRAQTLPMENWELVVVDSASSTPLESAVDLSWHPNARIVREDVPGSARARLRGMKETTAELLILVDDDNVLAEDYLAAALAIAEKWPALGVWGGSISPEFELPPTSEVQPYLQLLALREIVTPLWSNVSTCHDCEPWGAGMCLRREVAGIYQTMHENSKLQLQGRVGKNLVCGEDTEICIIACREGWGMGVFPGLKVLHLIPRFRVATDYLVRMAESIQISGHLLNYKWYGILPPRPFSPLILLRHLLHFAQTSGLARRMYLAKVRSPLAAARIIKENSATKSPELIS